MKINIVHWAWGENKYSPATKTTGKADTMQPLCPQPSAAPGTALQTPPLHSPHIYSRIHPRQEEIPVTLPVSLFPHLAVSCASFILSSGMVTGT